MSIVKTTSGIAEGETILTKRGLIPIQEVVPGDKVWTKEDWVNVLGVKNNGIKKVNKITTKYGYSVVTTKEHIFVVSTFNGLVKKRLKNVMSEDYVTLLPGNFKNKQGLQKLNTNIKSLNNAKSIKLPEYLTADFAWLLGMIFGDGHVSHRGFIGIACDNKYPEIMNKISELMYDLFCLKTFAKKSKRKNGVGTNGTCLNFYSSLLINFLKINGLDKQKFDKLQVPKLILKSPINVQHAFVAGFFDADGCIERLNNAKKWAVVFSMKNISSVFMNEIHKVMLVSGIISSKKQVLDKNINSHVAHRLSVFGKSSQKLFFSLIGAHSVKIRTAIKNKKLNSKNLSSFSLCKTPYTPKQLNLKHINYKTWHVKKFVQLDNYNTLADEIKKGHVLVREQAKFIEPHGKAKTYNLVLEKEHLFWCNGFYVGSCEKELVK